MKNLSKIFILLIVIFNYKISIANSAERILFEINNKYFTSIDLEFRKQYLELISNNLHLSNEEDHINDFISVMLFNEEYNELNPTNRASMSRINYIVKKYLNYAFKKVQLKNKVIFTKDYYLEILVFIMDIL